MRVQFVIPVIVGILILGSSGITSTAFALDPDYSGELIVQSGDVVDGKTLTNLSNPQINNNGDVVFRGFFWTLNSGIFTPTSLITATGDTIDGKTLISVDTPQINDNGDVIFTGQFSGGSGIFTPTSLIAATGDTIDGKTLTDVFSSPQINNNGDVVFRGFFSGGSGIFTPTSLIAATGDTIDGKTLTIISLPQINDNGDIVFKGKFSGGSGIFTPTSLLVENGDTIDGKTLTFGKTPFGDPQINNSVDVVFRGAFSGGSGIFILTLQTATITEQIDVLTTLVNETVDDPKDAKKLTKKLDKTNEKLTPQPEKANKDLDKFLDKVEKLFVENKLTLDERNSLITALDSIRTDPTDDSITVEEIQTVLDAVNVISNPLLTLKDTESLTKPLNKAIDNLTPDEEKACKEMNKFIKDTNNLVGKGKLLQADADKLIESAQNIKDAIGCV